MICFKESVRVHPETLRIPAMWHALDVVQVVAPTDYDVTVTSGCDGHHKDGSKHYTGKAWDFRTKNFPQGASLQTWLRRVIQALGEGYFAQLEGDHLHVQWNGP